MVTDIGNVPAVIAGNGDGGFGGGGNIWAFMIFALIFGMNGNGGLFGGRNGGTAGVATENTVWAAQQFTTLDSGIRGVQNGLCDLGFALNSSIKDGFYSNAMQMKDGFYNVGNGIATSTYEIVGAIKDCCCQNEKMGLQNTQRIIDTINAQANSARDLKIAEQAQALSEQRITSTIMQNLQPPRPIPAYHVSNPYMPFGHCNV